LVCVNTDGSLEPLDVLRIAGDKHNDSSINVFNNQIQEIAAHPKWLAAYHASQVLPEKCQVCRYSHACGGGYLPHRWSKTNGYDNPSVYCDSLMEIFDHVWNKISQDLEMKHSEVQDAHQ
jgi:uncharacterized protein